MQKAEVVYADLINIFAGGAFSRASIFALGIMPYISASIVMQLLGMAIPIFKNFRKKVKVVEEELIRLHEC